jgi:sugar lactone lactonase YvrE
LKIISKFFQLIDPICFYGYLVPNYRKSAIYKMKNPIVLTLALLLSVFSLRAHPSYGIVVTENGDLFFSDVLHNEGTIWKLSPDGQLHEILTGQHSHFLFLDQQGQIWGTDHDYIPGRETNRNTLWRLSNGKKQIVIPPTEDPAVFSGVNFVVGPEGHIYYNADRKLYVLDPQGNRRLLSDHEFGRIMSLQLARDGQVLVVDNNAENGSLIKVSDRGELTRLAVNLLEAEPPNPPFEEPRFNLLYAAFAGEGGDFFVANSGSRRISRIDPSGKVEHIYHSEAPWYPVAYTEKDGIGYVMEMCFLSGIGNLGPQIRRLDGSGSTLLLNVDAAKMPPSAEKEMPEKTEQEKETEKGAIGSPSSSSWLWYLLGGILVLIFIARFRKQAT